jgi:hypothetical protein
MKRIISDNVYYSEIWFDKFTLRMSDVWHLKWGLNDKQLQVIQKSHSRLFHAQKTASMNVYQGVRKKLKVFEGLERWSGWLEFIRVKDSGTRWHHINIQGEVMARINFLSYMQREPSIKFFEQGDTLEGICLKLSFWLLQRWITIGPIEL